MKKLLFLSLFLGFSAFAADDLGTQFQSLGGNEPLLEKVKALEGMSRVEVVQARTVNRIKRTEFSFDLAGTAGGDPYFNSSGFGLTARYHINPRWMLGLNYTYFTNELSREGENLITDTETTGTAIIPQMDHLKNQTMALIEYAPIYGKISFGGERVAQFDVYGQVGYGQMNLSLGSSSTYSLGGGMGVWWNNHFSTRFEMKYQNYTAQDLKNTKPVDLTVGSIQFGYLL